MDIAQEVFTAVRINKLCFSKQPKMSTCVWATFRQKICDRELSKFAQSGHTVFENPISAQNGKTNFYHLCQSSSSAPSAKLGQLCFDVDRGWGFDRKILFQDILLIIFKMGHPRPLLVYFWSFSNKFYNQSIQFMVLGFELTTFRK